MRDLDDEVEENGWGSDDDILDQIGDDEDAWKDIDEVATPVTTNRRVAAVEVDGWDDDDLNDLEEEDGYEQAVDDEENVASKTKNVTSSLLIPPPPRETLYNNSSPLERELEDYIASIPASIAQVNRILSKDYNTREKAVELQHYYASRPQLLQYTLEKEFPRMEYTLRLQKNGPLLKDKAVMAQLLPQHDGHSLCGRCANQSLLVDVLQAMSLSPEPGVPHDAVLPTRFMATAIATNCHFTIDIPASSVHVEAQFQVSLPLPTTGRWILGHLPVTIDFTCPHPSSSFHASMPPKVKFCVLNWTPAVPRSDQDSTQFRAQLKQCVAMLQEHHDLDHFVNEESQLPPSDARFRDAFLQRISQSSIIATTEGLHSAWQDLDAATGLVSKLQHIPSLLPSPLKEEDEVVAPRPTSLWGGLVRTIAQSLPTEPEVYDDPVLMAPAVKEAPRLYNLRQEPPSNTAPAPQLYNRPEPPPKVAPVPRLYNIPTEPMVRISEAPRLYNRADPSDAPQLHNKHSELANVSVKPPLKVDRDQVAAVPSDAPAEGWDEEDDEFWKDEALDISGKDNKETREEENDVTNWVYDPVTDIIPTRTRWVNPIPGPRDLRYM